TKCRGPERIHRPDQHVPGPAAAFGVPADDAVRVRRQRSHGSQRQPVGGRNRPGGVQAHLAGPEVRADQGRPGADSLPQHADRIAPAGRRPDAGLGEPQQLPKPTPPFAPFPPGYPQAQSPIAHTTHTHGIEVLPQFDGTPDTWFTNNGIHGPEFVSNDYTQPSSNQSAAFWYHDHAFGVTRLDVGMGLSGFSMLRDPNNALDVLGDSDILGMEDVYQWKLRSGVAPNNSTTRTQGSFSVSI